MIRIGDFGIQADTDCWIVGEVRTRTNKDTQEDEEYIYRPSYCSTVGALGKRLFEDTVRSKDPETADEFVAAIREGVKAVEILMAASP